MRDDDGLAADLAVLAVRFARHLRLRRRTTHMLTVGQLSILTLLHRDGPTTPVAIAKAERVQSPTVVRTLTALEQAALITRSEHPTDRRNTLISVTPAGTQALIADARAQQHWLRNQLAHLSPAQRRILANAATIINDLVDTDDSSRARLPPARGARLPR